MDEQTIISYFQQAQKYTRLLAEGETVPLELLQLIAEHQKNSMTEPYEAFFKGEQALFSGENEQALRCYLQAKGVWHYEFFCFRASALVSLAHGQEEKAQSFAHKALKMVADDPLCLKIASGQLASGQKLIINALQHSLVGAAAASAMAAPGPMSAASENDPDPVPSTMAYEAEPAAVSAALPLKPIRATPSLSSFGSAAPVPSSQLEKQMALFHAKQPALVQRYLDTIQKDALPRDHCLQIIGHNAWKNIPLGQPTAGELSQLFAELSPQTSQGGVFVRWNGKGIAINPKQHFLALLHEQQLHIRHIDAVIVTHEAPEIFQSVQEIYELNYKLNQVASHLHLIDYYFDEKTYQCLSAQLKPNFKQERMALHCLELFVDSPDVETIELAEGIKLHYFHAVLQEAKSRQANPCGLGIKLELSTSQEGLAPRSLQLGYIGPMAWSPLLSHLLGACDVLIAAFGHTCPNDYGKINYNESCLGYFGTYSLLEEIHPHLLLCTEFAGKEGDIRIEAVQQLRQEAQGLNEVAAATTILPADHGFFLNLITWEIACSVTGDAIAPHLVRVAKPCRPFQPLQYLSSACCLC